MGPQIWGKLLSGAPTLHTYQPSEVGILDSRFPPKIFVGVYPVFPHGIVGQLSGMGDLDNSVRLVTPGRAQAVQGVHPDPPLFGLQLWSRIVGFDNSP